MRILATQPESMGNGKTGSLTLKPMGEMRRGSAFRLIVSLIFDQSTYSKRVSCSLQYEETLSR